jgi:hypothetical protein
VGFIARTIDTMPAAARCSASVVKPIVCQIDLTAEQNL